MFKNSRKEREVQPHYNVVHSALPDKISVETVVSSGTYLLRRREEGMEEDVKDDEVASKVSL